MVAWDQLPGGFSWNQLPFWVRNGLPGGTALPGKPTHTLAPGPRTTQVREHMGSAKARQLGEVPLVRPTAVALLRRRRRRREGRKVGGEGD